MSLRKRRRRHSLAPPAGLPVESVVYNLRKILSQRDIAAAMGVSRGKAQDLEYTRSVQVQVLRRLRGLLDILYELNFHATFYGVRQWMRMPNRYLDGQRALDVYAKPGGATKIRAAIEGWVRSRD